MGGAVHSLDIIRDNKTPVFLAHGTDDGTVLFKTGRPLSDGTGLLKGHIPEEYRDLVKDIVLDIHAPTLYGSFVIDSLLTAKKVEHESYFVKGVSHEFYNDDEYTATVQNKVFTFLYKLASEDSSSAISRVIALMRPTSVHMGEGNRSFMLSSGNARKYAVVDLRGRIVLSGSVSAGGSVNLNVLGSGVYLLRVQGEKPLRFGLKK